MSKPFFTWPKDEPVLTLRCLDCSSIFDAYPGDEDLVQASLCPACFLERQYGTPINRLLWAGIAMTAISALILWAWIAKP